ERAAALHGDQRRWRRVAPRRAAVDERERCRDIERARERIADLAELRGRRVHARSRRQGQRNSIQHRDTPSRRELFGAPRIPAAGADDSDQLWQLICDAAVCSRHSSQAACAAPSCAIACPDTLCTRKISTPCDAMASDAPIVTKSRAALSPPVSWCMNDLREWP